MEDSPRQILGNQVLGINADQLNDLHSWIRPLKQALAIEAEQGFINIRGKKETFHTFINRELLPPDSIPISSENNHNFHEFVDLFSAYQTETINQRKISVVKLRKFLHLFYKIYLAQENSDNLPKISLEDNNSLVSKCQYLSDRLTLESPISELKGVGSKISEKCISLGIFILRDLLKYYPRDYVDYSSLRRISDLEAGKAATIIASVRRVNHFISPRNSKLSIFELHLQDKTGRVKVTRFFYGKRFSNYSYINSQTRLFPPGSTVAVSGLVKDGPFGKTFQEPHLEVLESPSSTIRSKSIGRLLPVYPLTEGLAADKFRELIEKALPLTSKIIDHISEERRSSLSLLKKGEAILQIHRPMNMDLLNMARRRIVFDEFFLLQLGLLRRRSQLRSRMSPLINITWQSDGLVGRFLELLPFSLTNAQKRVLNEIEDDLARTAPMGRLLQGDVGSGKTVVALAALLNVVQSGFQGALMAPTEVLAEQHYRTLCSWLPQLHVSVELLTGSTKRSRRREILKSLSNGTVNILVGTHALIEDPVVFASLGLVVVDEQHRFGVHQRNRLLSKGAQPHLLSMTATPIPRTLALSLYGDLDVSQIDELPPGRTPIKTTLVSSKCRNEVYNLIRDEICKGQRAYFVLPLVDESEKLDLRSAVEVHTLLSENIFSDLNVGLLHGRMSSIEKQFVIDQFLTGNCQLLVSTTVIEVGVDVPEATVMVIDHADRFGLSQLHQLRGRVGRGAKTSHCLLINDSKNPLAKQRLEVLVRSSDGFEISEIDLRLRGPGQVLGTRQSGLPDFTLASLSNDGSVLEEAREEAKHVLAEDPELNANPYLRTLLEEQWKRLSGNAHLN